MPDMNTVTISGRLTRDPEAVKTQTGIDKTTFTLAVNRRKGRDQEEAEADFIRCVAWRSTAEYAAKYMHKGDKVGVTGQIQTRNYQDNDGKTVWITEVIAKDITFLSSAQKQEPQFTETKPEPAPKPEPTGEQIQFDYGTRTRSDSVKLSEIKLDPASDDLPF